MNTELAKAIAKVLPELWNRFPPGGHKEPDTKQVYDELIARGIEVPEGEMSEIVGQFKKAGIIGGPGYINRDAHKLHGGTVITSVDQQLLADLDFD